MIAENDPGEFSGDLESEDKSFIFDLVVRECSREWDCLDKSRYQCAQQCVICSGKSAHGLEASASLDLTDGQRFTFPFEKRKIFISQLVHEFFESRWKAKQIENKMLRMLNLRSSQLENVNSSLATDIKKEDSVPPLQNEIKLDGPLQALQIVPEIVKIPENSGPRTAKTIICSKPCNQSDIKPEHTVKKEKEDSVCENREVIIYGCEESSKNTSLKRPRNETENDILCEKSIDIDMENKYGSNKKPKLLRKASLKKLEKLVHFKQKYNSYSAAKTVVRTEKEIEFLKDIPENLLRRANDREKHIQNEFVKSTNRRYSADLRKPKPPYYNRDDRFPSNRYSAAHRKPKPTYSTRGDGSPNNKHLTDPRTPKPTYHIKTESSRNSCVEKKFNFRRNDRLKPKYKNKHCFKRKVDIPRDKTESDVGLPVNDISAAFSLDRKKVDIQAYQVGLANMGWNPTQALYEICSQSQWSPPQFWQIDPVTEEGFLSCVLVHEHVFPAQHRGTNKRAARHLASVECLRYLGFSFTYDPSQTS